jgi:iron-sulfur cluster repair protein YtfE (RIC family)
MGLHHKSCDELFALAETAGGKNNWSEAAVLWEKFSSELRSHIDDKEEGILFPAFEKVNGPMGPTQVMRMEHEQMRALVTQVEQCIAQQDRDKFLGLTETLMILMQQHNMKEEQILYPMIDNCVDNAAELIN